MGEIRTRKAKQNPDSILIFYYIRAHFRGDSVKSFRCRWWYNLCSNNANNEGYEYVRAAPSSQFIILISAVTGLVIHIIMGHPNYVYGLSLAAGAFVGGAIGSKLLGHIREGILRIFLSISLLFVSSRLIFGVIDDL